MNARQTEGTREGFVTVDGWSVRFDRFVTSLGDVEIRDDEEGAGDGSCVDYSEADYTRLFDFTVAEPRKVGLVYGLGTCSAQFEVGSPQADTLFAEGVTSADRDAMRIEDSDDFVENERTGLIAQGRAERDGVVKTFSWAFRKDIDVERCKTVDGEGSFGVVELVAEGAVEMTIEVRGEELFREGPSDSAPLVFDRIAGADADADGDITLEELAAVELPLAELVADAVAAWRDDLPDNFDLSLLGEETLGTLVYMFQVPRIARFAGGGACALDVFDRRRF